MPKKCFACGGGAMEEYYPLRWKCNLCGSELREVPAEFAESMLEVNG